MTEEEVARKAAEEAAEQDGPIPFRSAQPLHFATSRGCRLN